MARTKAQKQAARDRAKQVTAANLARIGMLQDDDRHRRESRRTPEDPRKTALAARTRQIGAPKGSLDHPIYGHTCGVAIDHEAQDWDEAAALWQVFHRLDCAHGLYCGRVIGIRRNPAVGRIDLVHERLEADATSPPADTRSEDERHRDAANAWRLWQARLARCPQDQQMALMGVLWGRVDTVRSGRVLRAGRQCVEALRRIREECERGR